MTKVLFVKSLLFYYLDFILDFVTFLRKKNKIRKNGQNKQK